MLDILKGLENDNQYDNDFTLIQDLIKRINSILSDDNITNDFIDKMDNDLNYLDQKYDDLFDLINLFDPVRFELKKKNHIKYVEKLREENTFTDFMKKKIRDTTSYFKGVLENIEIILNNNFYATKDKINFKKLKEKIESWYTVYNETNTLKGIEAKDLENIDLEITDFFDKYIIKEPVEENYAERLLYDFGHLEENWKQEMLGGNKDGRQRN